MTEAKVILSFMGAESTTDVSFHRIHLIKRFYS